MEILDSPPPRRVTLSGRVAVLLRGHLVVIGSLVLGFGMFAFWTYVLGSPLFNPEPAPDGLVARSARIVSARETGSFDTGEVVVRYVYAYEVDGETHVGRAHTSDWLWDEGGQVEVQIDPERPWLSRLPGGRRARYGPGAEQAGLFPLFGAALLAAGLFLNGRELMLLTRGRVVRASVTARRNGFLSAGYRFTMRFKDEEGKPHESVVRSSDAERFARGKLPMLYRSSAPSQAALAADLASLLVADATGTLVPPSRALRRVLLVPCVALLPHVAWGLWTLVA